MLLFFKSVYCDAILCGAKTDTIRRPKRLPKLGSVVQACVGPSRIFARLRIIAIEPIVTLSPERLVQVQQCYGHVDDSMVCLRFELIREISPYHTDNCQPQRVGRLAA